MQHLAAVFAVALALGTVGLSAALVGEEATAPVETAPSEGAGGSPTSVPVVIVVGPPPGADPTEPTLHAADPSAPAAEEGTATGSAVETMPIVGEEPTGVLPAEPSGEPAPEGEPAPGPDGAAHHEPTGEPATGTTAQPAPDATPQNPPSARHPCADEGGEDEGEEDGEDGEENEEEDEDAGDDAEGEED